jgi:hypothetical protein
MFWVATITLGVIYIAAVSLVLIFLNGAARANERWDRSNEALWQARCDEERIA